MEELKDIGVVGIFGLLVIRMLLDRLQAKQQSKDPAPTSCRFASPDVSALEREVERIHDRLDVISRDVITIKARRPE